MKLFSQYVLFFLTICFTLINARSSLTPGQSLTGNQTLISANNKYEFGFLSPQGISTSKNYYIGIWYKNISDKTPFWIGNRDAPISDPNTSQLTISQKGNLVILNQSQMPIWSTNYTHSKHENISLVARLLDTGNLVITNALNSSDVIWQSFYHPTDIIMTGEWFGTNMITGENESLISWKSSNDPGSGRYSLQIDPSGSGQCVLIWNQSKIYWYSGKWAGNSFSWMTGMPINVNLSYDFVDDQYRQQYRFTVKGTGGPNFYTRLFLSVNGEIQGHIWSYSSNQWIIQWSVPDLCNVYSVCGAFSICDMTSSNQYCQCLPGFEPASQLDWNLNSWSGGCVRISKLRCGKTNSSVKGSQDEFSVVSNIMLPDDGYELKQAEKQEECKLACFNNCSCSAYAHQGNQCFIWNGEIRNLKLVPSDYSDVIQLYLRLSGSDLPGKQTSKKIFKVALLATIGGFALIVVIVFSYFSYQRWRFHNMVKTNGHISQFSYFFIEQCTNKFSHKIGEGSFGPVFKGNLPDLAQIAVKRLARLRQGEKHFKTEVKTLGNIQHVNLIRLRGFCLKGEERLLVYDFMPNGSLDAHLFDKASTALDWKLRFQIIIGVARGLAYLHEHCRECIIHCDIKPENILLDFDFSPKISDFGMAKLLGREFEDALTTTRGTIGYLAPEWISGLPITPKVDVYSYGKMLFEIISGKRNSEHNDVSYFPVWATIQVSEGEVESLLDEKLNHSLVDLEELTRVARLACWCIQDWESHRPTMAQAVHILEGSQPVSVAPVPRSLQEVASDCLSA